MSVSVIIPTWQRPESLARALDSLERQTLPTFEVIVVDNAADRRVATIVERAAVSRRLRISYIAEPRLGLHNARHRGAEAAAYDLLVFTDDDASFLPGWLNAYEAAFRRHPELAAASGPVRPAWAETPPEWLAGYVDESLAQGGVFPALSLLDRGPVQRVSERELLIGVNMAIRRTELKKHGGFSPELFGTTWLGDGESGLNRRLTTAGSLLAYIPEAVVNHHIDEDRMRLDYLVRRMGNEGAVHVYARFHGKPVTRLAMAAFVMRGLVAYAPFLGLGAAMRGLTGRNAMRVQLAAAHRWGRIKYAWRLFADGRLRGMVACPESHSWDRWGTSD